MTPSSSVLSFVVVFLHAYSLSACKCYVETEVPVKEVIKTPQPHKYLSVASLPARFDWRNVNSTNFCSKVLTQQSPNVCGSCWAEAATGSLSDRYAIATGNRLRVQLAPQQLLNFNKDLTGGSCNGGSDIKAFEFMHLNGIADDTCAVFEGRDAAHGFELVMMTKAEDIRKHQCFMCNWDGQCTFVPKEWYDVYGVDEFGSVFGVDQMKAEIYARGPISCHVNSEAKSFDQYHGGIVKCDPAQDDACKLTGTDHVIVIAGWGVEESTGTEYWVGRNSYGSRWGEGAGGGWFRLELGKNTLNMESHNCTWATPAKASVDEAIRQFNAASSV